MIPVYIDEQEQGDFDQEADAPLSQCFTSKVSMYLALLLCAAVGIRTMWHGLAVHSLSDMQGLGLLFIFCF